MCSPSFAGAVFSMMLSINTPKIVTVPSESGGTPTTMKPRKTGARGLWYGSQPVTGSIAERYLRGARGSGRSRRRLPFCRRTNPSITRQ